MNTAEYRALSDAYDRYVGRRPRTARERAAKQEWLRFVIREENKRAQRDAMTTQRQNKRGRTSRV